ncbi:hypothetical protein AVEN_270155-1 [Araneus ventricosus]|uniref:Uncharacterized protein n=1 Tax=Araneus ventricosus TaxID=182803 RepID=A0A4Y2XC99_ARAVE|nr:hypothetical protein AVEN_270155-1 [Araneus ventricosus]
MLANYCWNVARKIPLIHKTRAVKKVVCNCHHCRPSYENQIIDEILLHLQCWGILVASLGFTRRVRVSSTPAPLFVGAFCGEGHSALPYLPLWSTAMHLRFHISRLGTSFTSGPGVG